MIDNFSGIDTEGGGGGGRERDYGFCHRRHAVMNLKDRSSFQYFITQGMGQSFMLLMFHTIRNFRGRTMALGRLGRGRGGIPGLPPIGLVTNIQQTLGFAGYYESDLDFISLVPFHSTQAQNTLSI